MLGPPKTISENRLCEPISIKRARRDSIWMPVSAQRLNQWLIASHCSAAQLVTGKLLPSAHLKRLKFMTNHKRTISDFHQYPIPRVHEEKIVMKARVKKWQLLSVQVHWQSKASLQSQLLDCILHANSMLAPPQLAGTACCYSSFRCQMKPRDAFILFLCTALNANIYVKSTL